MFTVSQPHPRPRPSPLNSLASDHLKRLQRARANVVCALGLSGVPQDVRDLMEMTDVLLKTAELEASSIRGMTDVVAR